MCLFCERGHCAGFIHVCSASHSCSAPEIITTYQYIIKLRGAWVFLVRLFWDFLDKCSYVGRVWGIYFFSAGVTSQYHLSLQSSLGRFAPWPLGLGEPQQMHQVLVRRKSWSTKQQPPGPVESRHTQSGFNGYRMCGQKLRDCSRII